MKLQVILTSDAAPAARQGYDLDLTAGPVVLGRGPESPYSVGRHAALARARAFTAFDGQLALTDLSSNGVWLNGQPLPKKTAILCGPFDEVRIAGYTMTARLLTPPPPPSPRRRPRPQQRIARTDDIPAPVIPQPQPTLAPVPAWWKLDGLEKWTLILAAFAIALVALYRMG